MNQCEKIRFDKAGGVYLLVNPQEKSFNWQVNRNGGFSFFYFLFKKSTYLHLIFQI